MASYSACEILTYLSTLVDNSKGLADIEILLNALEQKAYNEGYDHGYNDARSLDILRLN